ncbi:MAG: hypothetical protein AAF125_04530 [Chloroflexota bacterium]
MNLIVWTLITGTAGTLAALGTALWALPTPHLYIVTVGAVGCVLAPVQGLLLPPQLAHERRAWMFYGLIGALGGTVVLWGADWYLDDIIGGVGFGAVVGLMGWSIIRDTIPVAWPWVIANMFGYAFVSGIVLLTKSVNRLYRAYESAAPLWLLALLFGVAAFVYALISGTVMRRLARQ